MPPHGWNQEIKVTKDGITGQEAGENLQLDWPRKDEKNSQVLSSVDLCWVLHTKNLFIQMHFLLKCISSIMININTAVLLQYFWVVGKNNDQMMEITKYFRWLLGTNAGLG